MNRNSERGTFIIGFIILLIIILLGIVLMNVMGGVSYAPSCGDSLDACKRNCGADIQCQQECERDYNSCIERVPTKAKP